MVVGGSDQLQRPVLLVLCHCWFVSVTLGFCQISEILRRYDKTAKGGITFEEFAHMCGHRYNSVHIYA